MRERFGKGLGIAQGWGYTAGAGQWLFDNAGCGLRDVEGGGAHAGTALLQTRQSQPGTRATRHQLPWIQSACHNSSSTSIRALH